MLQKKQKRRLKNGFDLKELYKDEEKRKEEGWFSMNLPQVNPRVRLVQKADTDFLIRHVETVDSVSYSNIDYGDMLKAYNQIIINELSKEKTYQSEFQKEMEEVLETISNKYELTTGEKLYIITKKVKSFADEIVSWERKN